MIKSFFIKLSKNIIWWSHIRVELGYTVGAIRLTKDEPNDHWSSKKFLHKKIQIKYTIAQIKSHGLNFLNISIRLSKFRSNILKLLFEN